MANLRVSAATGNAILDALRVKMDAGSGASTLKFYTGTQPAGPDTAVSTQTLLGTLTFTDPAAPSASSKTLTFSTITQDSSADATGTATWARVLDSDGNAIFDCDVGESGDGATITLNSKSIVSGGPISISSFVLTYP
jgi:hypothetical protein